MNSYEFHLIRSGTGARVKYSIEVEIPGYQLSYNDRAIVFRLIYSRDTEAMKIALMIFDRKCEENDKFVKVHPTLTLNYIFLVTQTIWVYASRIWLKRFNFDLKIFHHNILPDHENQNIQNIYLTVLILQGRTFSTAAG